jgi:fructose-specific phosphotransferase system IIC component
MSRIQHWSIRPAALLTIEIAGCRRAPTFNILGSFFPAWLLCLFAGITLSVVSNRIFARFALDKEILWPIVVYPCLSLFFAGVLWLIVFS